MISANPGHFFQTLFSVRWGRSAMLLALIPAVIGSLITPVLGTILFFVVFVPVWIIGAANPGNVLYCPLLPQAGQGRSDDVPSLWAKRRWCLTLLGP